MGRKRRGRRRGRRRGAGGWVESGSGVVGGGEKGYPQKVRQGGGESGWVWQWEESEWEKEWGQGREWGWG